MLFRTCLTSRAPAWQRQRICNHCRAVIMSFKEEVTDTLGLRPQDSYAHISPDEVRSIIVARPHSPHQIRPAEASALVDLVIGRAMRDEVGEWMDDGED